MGNISTNLLRFNGEIGPQYLDPDDKTGGPDGTMKPITKDVLREMIMLNLPEIQKVQDEYVKAELESIKQTQQQILQRLNQPINTQLTGSNAKVIHKIENDDILTTTNDYRFFAIGSGTGTQVTPVDVRKFKDKMVVFKNNMNDSVASIIRIYADLDKGASSINQIFNLPSVDIPAGESYIWNSIEYPVLKLPFIGIACQARCIGNSGTVDVLFLGGVL